MEQVIQIQYLDDSIPRLEYIGGKSDWIDLRAAETVSLKKGEYSAQIETDSQTVKIFSFTADDSRAVLVDLNLPNG